MVREGGVLQATPKTNPQTPRTSATDNIKPCTSTIKLEYDYVIMHISKIPR